MIKVSVVIPVYNVEDFLEECLDSVINQTLEDIEVICIDDGSTDNSLEILNNYSKKDSRIQIIIQENQGHAVATNNGIKLAKGKYLFLMDSDDILELNALEETYNVADGDNLDFVIFQAVNYYMDTNKLVRSEKYSMNALADYVGDRVFNYKDIKEFIFKITVTPWSKLYNREFILNSDAKFPDGLIFDDNVFFFDILFSAKRIGFLKKHLFKRRWHSSSSTTYGGSKFIDYIKISNLIWDVFKKHDVFDEFKEGLYSKKTATVYYWYKKINDKFKQDYFNEMKKDYLKLANNKDFIYNLNKNNKLIFESVLKSNNYHEFDLKMKNKKSISPILDKILRFF